MNDRTAQDRAPDIGNRARRIGVGEADFSKTHPGEG